MTRMSKQARERHRYPRKRKLFYKVSNLQQKDCETLPIAYKHHDNSVESAGLVFIPKIG